MKVVCGRALRGGSFIGGRFFVATAAMALRLRERLAPSRPSSTDGWWLWFASTTMGEYGRGFGAGENEETCRSITKSCVALVSFTMFVRNADERVCVLPYVLIALSNWMTI